MRCLNCSAENPQGAKFCVQCATPLRRLCQKCGSDNPPEARFCAQCATSLTGDQVGQPPKVTGPASSGIRVTLDNPEPRALDGERKTVTAVPASDARKSGGGRDQRGSAKALRGILSAQGARSGAHQGRERAGGSLRGDGARPAPHASAGVGAARALKFVGRKAELAQMKRALDSAKSGHGQLVAVEHEASRVPSPSRTARHRRTCP
jgi:ribosomal protein L40E